MARNPVLDAYGGFLKTNFPGSRVTEIGLNGDDDDEKKKKGTSLPAGFGGIGRISDFMQNITDPAQKVEFNPAMFLDGSQSPPPVDQVAPTPSGTPNFVEMRSQNPSPGSFREGFDAMIGGFPGTGEPTPGESRSDVSIPAKPGAIAAPEGPSQLDLEYMARGLLVPGDPTRRLDANQARGRIMDLGIDVDEPDFEAQTRAVAPRSFFDKIRGGISKIGEGLQREGVSEALGQFSRDIIATPDIGTALGPALSGAAAELELGEERIAGLEEQKRVGEMDEAQLVLYHLQRGDSQSAMQAMKAIEMMTVVPPEQDWQIYTSNPVMKDGVSGFLAVDKNSGEVKFFTADAVNASGAKADKDAILSQPALSANTSLTDFDRDFAMAGVPIARNPSGELYATSDASGLGAAFSKDGYEAMMGQFISQAVSGDESFFTTTAKDIARFFTRGDPLAEKVQQGYVDAYNFINPIVRYLSGAQMTDAEARRYYTALVPKPGDPFQVVMNKRRKRLLLAQAMQGDASSLGMTSEAFKDRKDRVGSLSQASDPTGSLAADAVLADLDRLTGTTTSIVPEAVEDEELPL